MPDNENAFLKLISLVKKKAPNLDFTILEIGALPINGHSEPFYLLAEHFSCSRVIGFEVDAALCDKLNNETPSNYHFYPQALGAVNGEVPFYITKNDMCCSLYKPNDAFNQQYNALDVCELVKVDSIETATLDSFCIENKIERIDFVKIDIQGAELDVMKGGAAALKSTLSIVSEVEFVPMYEGQPLFGDVCEYLAETGLMFHKFLGVSGRALKPMVVKGNRNFATQHMWADAVFVKDIQRITELDGNQLLKLALIAYMYGSPDLTFRCFELFDDLEGASLKAEFIAAIQ